MTDNSGQPSDNGAPSQASDKADHMIPKARLDEEIGKRKAVEAELAAVSEAFLAEVPEALKPLVPEGLSPADKIKWFHRAKATGVFKSNVPTTDTTPPKTTPKDRDLSTLPVHARIAAGYKT